MTWEVFAKISYIHYMNLRYSFFDSTAAINIFFFSLLFYLILQEKSIYQSFTDGNLLRNMGISGSYLALRIYMDAFNANCPLGSGATKHKLLG
jgi:hypothetical protein